MTRTLLTVGLLVGTVAVGAPEAAAGPTMGTIGDSISTGMDAKDDCNALSSCAGKLAEQWNYSWASGTSLANSMYNKWNASGSVRKAKNGSRLDDALGQAQAVTASGSVTKVTYMLGGNDVCQSKDVSVTNYQNSITAMQTHITNSFAHLANNLPYGSEVVVVSVPNVLLLRDAMRNRSNFAFSTCQDLWDLNTSNMHMNLVEGGFCDIPFLGWAVCGAINAVGQIVQTFVNPLIGAVLDAFEVQFPCGFVLHSNNDNPSHRSAAATLNSQINDSLATAVNTWNDNNNGVTFKWDNKAVYNYSFTSGDVSALDCFHPSVQGQGQIAKKVWEATQSSGASVSKDTSAPTIVSGSWTTQGWDEGSTLQVDSFYDTNEISKAHVYYESYDNPAYYCYYPDDPECLVGTLNQTPTSHEFGVSGLPDDGTCWAVDVKLEDKAGNKSGLKWSPDCWY